MNHKKLLELNLSPRLRRKAHAAAVVALIVTTICAILWRILVTEEERRTLAHDNFVHDTHFAANTISSNLFASQHKLAILALGSQIRDYLGEGPATVAASGMVRAGSEVKTLFSDVLDAGGDGYKRLIDALAMKDRNGNIVVQKITRHEDNRGAFQSAAWTTPGCPCEERPKTIFLVDDKSAAPFFVISQPVELNRQRIGTLLARVPIQNIQSKLSSVENTARQRIHVIVDKEKLVSCKCGTMTPLLEPLKSVHPTPTVIPTPQSLGAVPADWSEKCLAMKINIPDTSFSLLSLTPIPEPLRAAELFSALAVAFIGTMLLGAFSLLTRGQTERMLLKVRLDEQRQASEKIHKHIDDFNVLFNSLPGLAWRKDNKGRYIMANSATCQFFGLSHEELMGKTSWDLFPAKMAEFLEEGERPLFEGERRAVEREVQLGEGDGRKFFVRRMVSVMGLDGSVEGIIGLTMEITQTKRAEELAMKTAAFQTAILELAINFVNREIDDLEQGIEGALGLVASYCEMDRACFFRYDYCMETLSLTHEWRTPSTPSIKGRLQSTPTSLIPGLVEAHRARKNFSIPSVEALPRNAPVQRVFGRLGTKSLIAVPLYNTKACFGFIGLASITREKAWSESELKLLVIFAELLTNAKLRSLHEERLIAARNAALESYDLIEIRIKQRTHELASANQKLQSEITWRMQLIRDLETIQNSISAILIAVDERNQVTRWNSAAEKAFGLNSPETVGKTFYDLTLTWDWNIVRTSVVECLSTQKSYRAANVGYVNADGRDSLLMLTVSPLQDNLREQAGYIILGEDITEIKTLEAQLSQTAKMEAVGQLAAGIAHEINTPTQYVSDSTTFLREVFHDLPTLFVTVEGLCASESSFSPKAVQQLKDVLRDIDLTFIQRELPATFSRIETGIDKISSIVKAMNRFAYCGIDEKKMTDINELLENALIISQNEWKYVAKLSKDFENDLNCVMCSPGDLSQVFLNVIINAAHAIEEKVRDTMETGTITVSTRNAEGCVEIRIADTGVGVPEHLQDKIFNLFFTTKTIGKGTGQGLAIAYDTIVNKHNGRILFESRPGTGSSFLIRIPTNASLL